ncbi:MAG: type II toxin-antitoxin system HipA family toxin [Rhodobacteraceae bacterium]|nr:type II toxin-antitoxin system HipA family toxin [Paracoccaceae bacterium]
MARRKTYRPLSVFLNTRHVGQLSRQPSGAIAFSYAPDWLGWEHTMPISLSLPLREDRYVGAPVLAVFDNLLPDAEDIRRHVAEKRGADGTDPFSLLSAVGRDCVGALQFLPEGEEPNPTDQRSGDILNENALAEMIANLKRAPLGLGEDQDFRISVAGAQEKTALLYEDGQWIRPHGTTPTTHILKPQIGTLPIGVDLSNSVENEHLCLRILAAFGLDVATTDISDFGDRRVLVVERFDRRYTSDGRLLRLPQEDFCQALGVPSTLKYQNEGGPGMAAILEQLKGSDEPEKDRRDFLKAQILFWMLAATDGHAKNFSVFLLPGGRFRMTPFYDVISVQPAIDAGTLQRQKVKLAMFAGKKRHYLIDGIMPRHFAQTAQRAGAGKTVVDEICAEITARFDDAWTELFSELPAGFPEDLVASLLAGMQKRLPLLEAA